MEISENAKKINALRGALIAQGLSFAGWARKNGYKPITVRQAVARHWGKPDQNFTGIKTQEILVKLETQFPEAFIDQDGRMVGQHAG